jgi:hypothetical protein
MQDANVYLNLLSERGKKGLPVKRVYRQLYNRHLYPRVAQRDTYLAKTAPDKVSAMCRILSWNYAQEARSKGAMWVKQPVEPLIS